MFGMHTTATSSFGSPSSGAKRARSVSVGRDATKTAARNPSTARDDFDVMGAMTGVRPTPALKLNGPWTQDDLAAFTPLTINATPREYVDRLAIILDERPSFKIDVHFPALAPPVAFDQTNADHYHGVYYSCVHHDMPIICFDC